MRSSVDTAFSGSSEEIKIGGVCIIFVTNGSGGP